MSAQDKPPTKNDALELMRLRNNFYVKNYRNVLKAILILLIICLFTMVIVGYLYWSRPSPVYFATGEQCQLVPMVPLSEPYVSSAKVAAWSSKAVQEIFNYGYNNYQQHFSLMDKYFTSVGYNYFMDLEEQSGNLNTIRAKKLFGTAKLLGEPIIKEEGVVLVNGVPTYMWILQLNSLLTYESSLAKLTYCARILLRVLRVELSDYPLGIAINSLIRDTSTPRKSVDGSCIF